MSAYYRGTVEEFVNADPLAVIGRLEVQYADDGYSTQYSTQTTSWQQFVPLLQNELNRLVKERSESASWGLLVEYPLYRLRKRIDAVESVIQLSLLSR